MMTDCEIIRLLENRDEASLSIIEKQYGKVMKMISKRVFDNDGISDECLNDALLDIWNTIPPQKPISLMSYGCMLIRRRTIDRLRREKSDKRQCDNTVDFEKIESELRDVCNMSAEICDKITLTEYLNEFLRNQSKLNREIFISRYFDFEGISEIAKRIGISENSVSTRLHRMRTELKSILHKGEYFNG